MKTSSILLGLVIAVVVVAGGWYWMQQNSSATPTSTTQGPNTHMGTNGSPNQGTMGQQNTGATQQPQSGTPSGDGTGPAVNLTLGTNGNAKVGSYLIGYNGMTLYTYAKDTSSKSNCTGSCAQAWPPYTLPAGTPINLQSGVSGKAALIARADGTMQVAYNGRPLYFYAGDKTGSDVNGQGLGGVWYVAKP